MPAKRVAMHIIKEVLRLKYDAALSHRQIAAACGISKGVVAKFLALAEANGLKWPLPETFSERDLEERFYPCKQRKESDHEPDWFSVHQELKKTGVTRQLLWSEHIAKHPDYARSYTTFSVGYRKWKQQQKRSLRQTHTAGEKLFIDHCGPTMGVINQHTGELRSAQIFVAVLGASSYTFAEATWTQSLPDWIGSNQRALQFFGGVPALLVPDNLKSASHKACRYDPVVNRTYTQFAAHYGTAVLPTRPYKPQDKAKAEAGVLLVERWILAVLRHQEFFSLAQLNQAIAALLPTLNGRAFQGRTESRRDLFEALDRPALRALPDTPYEYDEWSKAKVNIDYHISFEKRLYSVPNRLVGHTVEIRTTAAAVEIFERGKRVASHPRHGDGRYSTISEHMPVRHREHSHWSPSRFIDWGASIGNATAQVVRSQLEDRPHPEHGYRACLGLKSLCKRYGASRLENACIRALSISSASYTSINSILKQGLDQQTQDLFDEEPKQMPEHANVRGANYYASTTEG